MTNGRYEKIHLEEFHLLQNIYFYWKKKGKPKFPTKMFSGDWLSKGYYTLWQDVYTVVKI